MKICHYQTNSLFGPISRMGILIDDSTVIDPNLIWRTFFQSDNRFNPAERANLKMPTSLYSLLNLYDSPIDLLNETHHLFLELNKKGLETTLDSQRNPLKFKLSNISLQCPLDKIGVYRDFFTFEKHVAKGFARRGETIPKEWYEFPVYYKGNPNSFIGTNQVIPWPSYSALLDYELELAVVIGREGKNIREENALNHVFGISILNDISARDIQKKEMAVRLGPSKAKDFCTILGPVIVTMDEFNYKMPNLKMEAFLNGEKWSEGYSGDAYFSFSQMISFASLEEWILPGDLLGSGTVGTGCGLELDRWPKMGDKIELKVERIGSITNVFGNKNIEN